MTWLRCDDEIKSNKRILLIILLLMFIHRYVGGFTILPSLVNSLVKAVKYDVIRQMRGYYTGFTKLWSLVNMERMRKK